MNSAIGPPSTTVTVPTKNIASAFGPSRSVAGRSIDSVSSTSVAGNR
jgi:hypothetical protein